MTEVGLKKVGPWIALFLLGVAYFFSLLDRQILTVLVDPVKADLKISDTQFGLLQGFAFSVFYTAFGVPVGALADRWNRKLIIATGLFVWSLSTCLAVFARSFGWLFAARIGVGIGEASLAPAAYSMFADLFGAKRIGRVIGVFHTFAGCGMAVSVAIGGILFQRFSPLGAKHIAGFILPPWGMTLATIGVPGMVLALIILFIVREPVRESIDERVRDGAAPSPLIPTLLGRHGFFVRLIAGSSLISIASFGVLTWSAAYLMRHFQLSPAEAGVRFGLALGVGGIVGPLAAGALSDFFYGNWGEKAPLIVLTGCNLGLLIMSAALLFASSVNLAVVILVLFSTFISGTLALAASAIQLGAHGSVRAQVSAVWLCLNNLIGLGLGAFLVGAVTDHIFGSPAAVGTSISLVGFAAALPGTLLIASLLRQRRTDPILSEVPDSQSDLA